MQQNKATPIPLVFLVSGNLLLMGCAVILQITNLRTDTLLFCNFAMTVCHLFQFPCECFYPVCMCKGVVYVCLSVCNCNEISKVEQLPYVALIWQYQKLTCTLPDRYQSSSLLCIPALFYFITLVDLLSTKLDTVETNHTQTPSTCLHSLYSITQY